MARHEGPGRGAALSAEIAFRRATAADAAAVRDFTRRAYERWVPVLGREPAPMTADYDVVLRDHRVDLMMADGTWVGLIETVPDGEDLLIENVAIDPTFQGLGLGRRLMAKAEALAAEQGLGGLRLYTGARMTANIRLYAALGYRVDREEQHPEGRVLTHMSKALDP